MPGDVLMKIKSLMILLVVGVTAFFTVAAAEVNSQDAAQTYKAPALENAESWTMVVVPDVQGYSKLRRNYGILEIMHA